MTTPSGVRGQQTTGRTAAALQVRGLARAFGGVPAVDGVSLDVPAGTVLGLIGPNGSGKSTTVNLVAGALRADAGTVRVGETDISNRPPYEVSRRGLLRTFQIPRVWGGLTVFENLLVAGTPLNEETIRSAFFGRRSAMRRQRAVARRAHETLEHLKLGHLADAPAAVLSGGQKRLLEFGRLMLADARIALLDEPFAGVNPAMISELQFVIEELRAGGAAVLLVEHNLAAVEQTCDRVMVMAVGKVIAEGTMAEVRADPAVIQAYLGTRSSRA